MPDEPKIIALPRPRGRPKSEESKSAVSSWVNDDLHDQLLKEANRADLTLSAYLRTLLSRPR